MPTIKNHLSLKTLGIIAIVFIAQFLVSAKIEIDKAKEFQTNYGRHIESLTTLYKEENYERLYISQSEWIDSFLIHHSDTNFRIIQAIKQKVIIDDFYYYHTDEVDKQAVISERTFDFITSPADEIHNTNFNITLYFYENIILKSPLVLYAIAYLIVISYIAKLKKNTKINKLLSYLIPVIILVAFSILPFALITKGFIFKIIGYTSYIIFNLVISARTVYILNNKSQRTVEIIVLFILMTWNVAHIYYIYIDRLYPLSRFIFS